MGQLATNRGNGSAAHAGAGSNGQTATRIRSYAPATGELIGEAKVWTPDEVKDAVKRARQAQESWGALPVEARCERILRFRDAIVDRADEIVDLLVRECGKPRQEALLHEVIVVADLATHFAKIAPRVLAPHDVSLHLLKHRRSIVHYRPRGVVAVISPWNFPFQLPLRDTLIALLAGNAVIIKPSEVTPLIALKAKEIWDTAGLPEDLLQVCPGYAPTGAALIDAMPDFVILTGSVATGRRVAAACGERLIPCVMELGGKAPLIACSDASIERTARSIVHGGFANSGQVCISVERVYAHADVHDALVERVVSLTNELRQGDPNQDFVDVGAIIFPHQIDVAEKHIADALSKGGRVLAGGKRKEGQGQFFEPTVIDGCNHSMTVMTEEIFGPIIPIMKVSSDEEAIALANDSHLGLNAYVFSDDKHHAMRLAERIEAGGVLVNDVLTNGGTPDTPFGGIKASGFGRTMGDESLREMSYVKHICVDRIPMGDKNPLQYPYTAQGYTWFRKGLRALFSGGGVLQRIGELL